MPKRKGRFVYRHSLSIAAIGILMSWIVLYAVSDPSTHLGSFFGNAIADWWGVVVMVLRPSICTKRALRKAAAHLN